jgi:surface protein
MGCFFYGCESLKNLDVSKLNTEKVTNMCGMFYECKSLNYLDLSKFNTRKVINMNNMFSGCTLLKDINAINFIPTRDVDCINMFSDCDSFPYGCIIYSNLINAKNNKIDNNDINNIISKLKSKQNIIEYNNKINYKFIKEPNLKYKLKTNYGNKFTIFEIFTSYIDNTDYIAFSDDSDNKNLKIYYFYENKLKKKVSFESSIKEIRYFINKNNYNEYLLIILDFGVNILYITNNYINIYEDYHNEFDDCLLVFPNKNDIYFVHSYRIFGTTGYYSDEIEHYCYAETWAKLLFTNKSFLYSEKEEREVYLLLSWYNKKIIYIILYN